MLLERQKHHGQNGGFHREYSKLDRFLSVLNFNKKSIEVNQVILFEGLINHYLFLVHCTTNYIG
jgi:hypothetical protein